MSISDLFHLVILISAQSEANDLLTALPLADYQFCSDINPEIITSRVLIWTLTVHIPSVEPLTCYWYHYTLTIGSLPSHQVPLQH